MSNDNSHVHPKCKKKPNHNTVGDVVIVGGGIVGTSLAMFLSSTNMKVTLLEKQSVASEATGLSAGTIYNAGIPKAPGSGAAEHVLHHLSTNIYANLHKTHDIEFTKCGCLQLANTEEELVLAKETYERESALMTNPSSSIHFLDTSEKVQKILPEASSSVLGAVYTPNSSQVNASLAAHAFAELASSNGATIVEKAQVKSINKKNNVYTVTTTDNNEFLAKIVVVAAGINCNDVLDDEYKINLFPVKGQMRMSGLSSDNTSFNSLPVIYWFESYNYWKQNNGQLTHDNYLKRLTHHAYGKRSPNGKLFFGGDRFAPQRNNDYDVSETIISDLFFNKIYTSIPELEPFFENEEAGAWSGIMPFACDGLPTIDVLDSDGLYIAAGFGANGIMLGPGASYLLSKWIKSGNKQIHLKKFERRN